MRVSAKHLVGLLALAVILASCGRGPGNQRAEERPGATPEGTWETAWVDPQIVLSDSLFTLIRSDRVDSFLVTRPSLSEIPAPSIMFTVTSTTCPVSVNLFSPRDEIVAPLLMQTLKPGHYKLTIDFSRVNYKRYPKGVYRIRVNSCGINKTATANRD
jgi:hypothetical protein